MATKIAREDWLEAPRCPIGMTDPMLFGRDLFSGLQKWAKECAIPSASLRFWDAGSPHQKPYQPQSAVWQIAWEDGPETWAIFLLHGQSHDENGSLDAKDGKKYYLEPADGEILGMASL